MEFVMVTHGFKKLHLICIDMIFVTAHTISNIKFI